MTRARTSAPLRPSRPIVAAIAAAGVSGGCLGVLRLSPLDVVAALVMGLLVWLAAIDLEFRLVPNRIVLPAIPVVLVAAAVLAPDVAPERIVAAAGAGAALLLAALIRPRDLGMGDVKLAMLLGATLGASVVTALAVGFGAVGLVGLARAARMGRAALKAHVPLVPFLAFGAVVAALADAL